MIPILTIPGIYFYNIRYQILFDKMSTKYKGKEKFDYNKFNEDLLKKNLITPDRINMCAFKAAYTCYMCADKIYFNKSVYLKCIDDYIEQHIKKEKT